LVCKQTLHEIYSIMHLDIHVIPQNYLKRYQKNQSMYKYFKRFTNIGNQIFLNLIFFFFFTFSFLFNLNFVFVFIFLAFSCSCLLTQFMLHVNIKIWIYTTIIYIKHSYFSYFVKIKFEYDTQIYVKTLWLFNNDG